MGAGEWAPIAGAAGAFAAVIVALFGRPIRHHLTPPKLDLSLDPDKAGGFSANGTIWYHVQVSNPRRWSPVTAVRVFLLKVEMDGKPPWLGAVPLRWRFQKPGGEYLDMGSPRDCDLCAIGKDGPVSRLTLQQAIMSGGLPPHIASPNPPALMTLTLQARGLEADSAELKLALDWDGGRTLTLRRREG
jgi:hypothetical protein